jgi:hypothetical protein
MSDKIKAALAKLDPKNDNHWTGDGLPRIETLRLLSGTPTLTREEVLAVAPTFSRQSAAAETAPAPSAAPAATADTSKSVLAAPAAAAAPVVTGPTLDERYERAKFELGEMREAKQKLDQMYADQQALVDKLATELDGRKPPQHLQTMSAIQEYQRTQNELRAIRADKWATFKQSGVRLEDILPTKAKVDQAYANRRKKPL